MMDSMINSLASSIFTPEGPTVNPQYQPQINTQDKPQKWLTEERYAQLHTSKWTPKIEQQFKDGVLISQTIQYTPQGDKQPYPKKQWIGLTADEMESIYQLATYMDETDYIHLLMLAEEKLKEKNK
jgi:hypothetical protein